MTQEQGWDEESEHHDGSEEYPHAAEVPAYGDLAYKLSPVAALLGDGEPDVYPGLTPQDDQGAQGLRVIMEGAHQAVLELSCPPSNKWQPIGTVGELQAEYALLSSLFKSGLAEFDGTAPFSPTDWARRRIAQTLRIAKRMNDLHERITKAAVGYRDVAHMVVFAEAGTAPEPRDAWLAANVPNWHSRVDLNDHPELWTHYSYVDGRTLCGRDSMPSRRHPETEPGSATCPACINTYAEICSGDAG